MSIVGGTFYENSPIVFDKNFVIVDGGHRMAIIQFVEDFRIPKKEFQFSFVQLDWGFPGFHEQGLLEQCLPSDKKTLPPEL